MFKGMHTILQKIGQKDSEPSTQGLHLSAILSAEELLSAPHRDAIIKKLPALVAVSNNEFNLLYLKTLYNVAEFVQNLPETQQSYYSYQGGLLDHALDRTHLALSLCRAYFLAGEDQVDPLFLQQQALWIYAIFTASLLLDIGKIAAKQIITLHDNKSKLLKHWLPYEGPMTLQPPATHYKVEFEVENRERLRNLATPLLARQLLPSAGFNWIASDKTILEAWLAILEDDQSGGGLAAAIIPLADTQTIDSQLTVNETPAIANILDQDMDTDSVEQPPLPNLFTPNQNNNETNPLQVPGINQPTVATATTNTIPGSLMGTSTMMLTQGIAFLLWLRKAVNNGQITVNGSNALIHRTADGLVLLPKIFAEFTKANSQFKDAHVVAQQFSMLELTGRDQVFRHIVNNNETRIIKNAMLIKNIFSIFPESAKLPDISAHIVKIPGGIPALPAAVLATTPYVEAAKEPVVPQDIGRVFKT